jgi:hypothetical protein
LGGFTMQVRRCGDFTFAMSHPGLALLRAADIVGQ